MELITGSLGAEFGDKRLVLAQVISRLACAGVVASAISIPATAPSAPWGGGFGLGFARRCGQLWPSTAPRSGRFLDTPECIPYHAIGNNQTIFDRLDHQPTGKDVFHSEPVRARNWTADQTTSISPQRRIRRQRALTWNIARRATSTRSIRTRRADHQPGTSASDQFNYYGSRDVLDDQPATQNQQRQLLNWGREGRRFCPR